MRMIEVPARLFAFDLDNTAIESRHDALPSELLVRVVHQLIEQGDWVSVATSRPLAYAKGVLDLLQVNAPIVAAGGTQVIDYNEKQMLHEVKMHGDTLNAVEEAFKSIPTKCYFGDTTFSKAEAVPANKVFQEVGSDIPNAFYFLGLKFEHAKSISYLLRSVDSVRSFYLSSMVQGDDGLFDVHILPEQASKGSGLRIVQKLVVVPKRQTFAYGDNYNDVSLFDQAGHTTAIGCHDPELVGIADEVVKEFSVDALALKLLDHVRQVT